MDGQLLRLEEMVSSVEWETQQADVVRALRAGTDALNKLHETMSYEAVAALMDESAEARAKEAELSELLAGGLTADDEAELLVELEGLADAAPAFPDAPTALPAAPDTALPAAPARKAAEVRTAVAA